MRPLSELLAEFSRAGVGLTLSGETVIVEPASKASPGLIAEARERKPEILAHLREQHTPLDRPIRDDVAEWLMRQSEPVRRRWWRATARRYARCGNWERSEAGATCEIRGEAQR
jgi:hypothetical protein